MKNVDVFYSNMEDIDMDANMDDGGAMKFGLIIGALLGLYFVIHFWPSFIFTTPEHWAVGLRYFVQGVISLALIGYAAITTGCIFAGVSGLIAAELNSCKK